MSELSAPRPLVLDTSVAAKWYLPEELRDEALELATWVGTGEVQLLAPSIIAPELFNALYQQHRRTYLSLEEVRTFFSSFREAPVSLFEIDLLTSRAAEITVESGAVVYDALFLALAEEAGTVVLTADSKLLQVLRGTPYAHFAHSLVDVASLIPGSG